MVKVLKNGEVVHELGEMSCMSLALSAVCDQLSWPCALVDRNVL